MWIGFSLIQDGKTWPALSSLCGTEFNGITSSCVPGSSQMVMHGHLTHALFSVYPLPSTLYPTLYPLDS